MRPQIIYIKKKCWVLLTHVYWFRATGGYICGCGWQSNLVLFVLMCIAASPDGWAVWCVVMSTRCWLLVDLCVLRNWDRILVRAVKGLISRAGMVSICPLLWQTDVKLKQTNNVYCFSCHFNMYHYFRRNSYISMYYYFNMYHYFRKNIYISINYYLNMYNYFSDKLFK